MTILALLEEFCEAKRRKPPFCGPLASHNMWVRVMCNGIAEHDKRLNQGIILRIPELIKWSVTVTPWAVSSIEILNNLNVAHYDAVGGRPPQQCR